MSSYFQACSEISAHIADLENPTAKQIQQIQNTVAKKHHLSSTPKLSHISKKFVSKPIRSASGVSVIAVMCKPHRCPHSYFHNVCLYCPGGVDSDFEYSAQSYTGFEPTSMRAIRNRYSAYEQVRCRVRQLKMLGHAVSKVEVIIMGGTFLSLDLKYKRKFISDIYAATSGCLEPVKVFSHKQEDFSHVRDKISTSSQNERCCTEKNVLSRDLNYTSSEKEKCCTEKDVTSQPNKRDVNTQYNNVKSRQNGTLSKTEPTPLQTSKSLPPNLPFPYEFLDTARLEKCGMRIVGLTIETRPDFCTPKFIDEMLSFGTTRLEMGVQSVYEDIARNTNRGHSVGAVKKTFCVLKDCGYKIISHLMPNLPFVSVERDRSCFLEFFENPSFRADGLKIYPTLVIRNTGLYELWKQRKYTNYGLEFLIDFLADVMSLVPPYCRVYRIQRDIPVPIVSAGLSVGNVRELVEQRMKDAGKKCRDIRGREIGIRKIKEKGRKQQRQVALLYEDYLLSNRVSPKHSLNSPYQENCDNKMAVEAQKIRNFDFFTGTCRRGTQIEQAVFLNEKDDYEEFEVIRRDYVANEGWETFLSYENIEEDSLAGMLRMRKCGANVYREEMQTEGNFTYIKNKCKKITETKSEYVNNNGKKVEDNCKKIYKNKNENNKEKNVEDNFENNNENNSKNNNETKIEKNYQNNNEENNNKNNENNNENNNKNNNENNLENKYANNSQNNSENNSKNKSQYGFKQRTESNITCEIAPLNRFKNTSYSNQKAKISSECMEIIKSFHKNTPLKQEIREKIPNKLQITENYTNFKNNDENVRMPIFNTTLIREIHVYGDQANISKNDKKYQHRGIGKNLLKIAENIAKGEHKTQKIVIIAGIGVRDYYRKLGYTLEGAYMVKYI